MLRFCVRAYFAFDLIGDQVKPDDPKLFGVLHVPIFMILKFIFFYGWLAVADALEDPYGNDIEDVHIRALVSRHLWAIGQNLSLHEGPPENEDDLTYKDLDEEDDDKVKINIGPIKIY